MDSEQIAGRIARELGSTLAGSGTGPLHPPPRVADHELVRRIGEGSYGEVWLARAVTGQWRAVKAVSRDRFTSERPFEREFNGVVQFEPISRSHASLVQVLHVGRDDAAGAFYYVMELGDALPDANAAAPQESGVDPDTYAARTLRADLKARHRLPVAETVALGVELAGALGHIHRHGLVHRDVKPSNVIFVQGRAKLADLGLVTSTSEARSFVGTEGFIPPEGPGTAQADLFALGRLLYEAVTGKDRCEFPELPADLDVWPDREAFLEFNEVLTRLCAPDPKLRYANAAEVAGDLNLILAGRSVRRAYGIERRLARARRIAVATLLALALVAGVVWFQQARHRQAEERTQQERALRERAEKAERESTRQLYTALIEQARANVRSGELGQRTKALDAVKRAAAVENSLELRREALTALALPDMRLQHVLPFGAECTAVEPDPKFERLAVCRETGPVEIHSMIRPGLIATLPASHKLPCYNLDWSGDGRFLAIKRDRSQAAGTSELEIWNLESVPRCVCVVSDARHTAWSFHPHRAELVVAVGTNTIVRYDLEKGEAARRHSVEATPARLEHSPDGTMLAAGFRHTDGWAVSIHANDDRHPESRVLHVFPATYGNIAWHPKGRWVAVTDYDRAVHLMDPVSGEVRTLGRHRAEAVVVQFDPRGDYLFTGGWERSVICWDLRSMERAFTMDAGTWYVRLSEDGSKAVFPTEFGLQLYTLERPLSTREVPVIPESRVGLAAFSPDGSKLAVSMDDGVAVCDLASGLSVVDKAAGPRLFWRDSTELFGSGSGTSNGNGGGVHRWKVIAPGGTGGAPLMEPLPLTRPEHFRSFSLRGDRIAWTVRDGSWIADANGPPAPPAAMCRTVDGINSLSPDGRWLGVYVPNTTALHLHQLPDLHPVTVLTAKPRVTGFSFSPDGSEMALVSRGDLSIYSTETWKRIRGTTGVIGINYHGCLYQPDGKAMWLAKSLRDAGLRDAHSFEMLMPLPAGVFPCALSADGNHLAVSVEAHRVQVWNLPEVRRELRELGLDWTDRGR